jgi:hypothetical protein
MTKALFLNILGIYYVILFMKGSSYSYKLRYEGYLELICMCLLDNMYTELTHVRIPYGEIICINGKTCMTVS